MYACTGFVDLNVILMESARGKIGRVSKVFTHALGSELEEECLARQTLGNEACRVDVPVGAVSAVCRSGGGGRSIYANQTRHTRIRTHEALHESIRTAQRTYREHRNPLQLVLRGLLVVVAVHDGLRRKRIRKRLDKRKLRLFSHVREGSGSVERDERGMEERERERERERNVDAQAFRRTPPQWR